MDWGAIAQYGFPVIGVIVGGFIKSVWDAIKATKEIEINREHELFKRVHELWEQEIERHEICQDEVRALQKQLQKILILLARNGITAEQDG